MDKMRNDRWLNNPERRVGEQQMLRAMLAGMSETDPRYEAYLAMLEYRRDDSPAGTGRA